MINEEINKLETEALKFMFESLRNFIFTQKLVGGVGVYELKRAYELLDIVGKELEKRKINGV